MPDISMGDVSPPASPPEPVPMPATPKRPLKRPRPETPAKAGSPQKTDTVGSPRGSSPSPSSRQSSSQSQLGQELKQHVATAGQSRIAKLNDLQEEVSQLISQTTAFTAHWVDAGLPEAIALGQGLQHLFSSFSRQLNGEAPSQAAPAQAPPTATSYAEVCQASTPNNNNHHQPANQPTTLQQTSQSARRQPPPTKAPRVFLRLPMDHQARQASPHAALALFRQHPTPQIAKNIKEVQRVPSGLALIPTSLEAASELMGQQAPLEQAILGAKAELEQEWAVYALPHVPSSYQDFNGNIVEISEQMAAEEFTFQTGLKPHRFYISKNPGSQTHIMLLPKAPNQKVPSRVSLFGQSVFIRHKPPQVRITQCHQCWGFHNPRKCTRKPRCQLCSSPDHQAATHPPTASQLPRCTNCLGPHPADHQACPARPTVRQGSIHHLSRLQIRALRQAGSQQNPVTQPTGPAKDRPAQPTNSSTPSPCADA